MPRVSSSSAMPSVADGFIKSDDVVSLTSLSQTTIWRLTKGKKFPRSYPLSPGRVGWLRSDIDAWIAEHSPRAEEEAK